MRIAAATAILCGLMSFVRAPHARADFVLLPSSPPTQPASASSDTGGGPDKPSPPKTRYATAEGFGDHVPLSFAVRQIVPSTVKVHFGNGVDEAALVDWKGGRPWNVVLWSAIHPLGLHLYFKPGAAWITN